MLQMCRWDSVGSVGLDTQTQVHSRRLTFQNPSLKTSSVSGDTRFWRALTLKAGFSLVAAAAATDDLSLREGTREGDWGKTSGLGMQHPTCRGNTPREPPP